MNLDNLYFQLPRWLQDVSVSLYGLKLQQIRHGGNYRNIFNQIKDHLYYDENDLRIYQVDNFKSIFRDAIQYVPYYKDLSNNIGITSEDINDLNENRFSFYFHFYHLVLI